MTDVEKIAASLTKAQRDIMRGIKQVRIIEMRRYWRERYATDLKENHNG